MSTQIPAIATKFPIGNAVEGHDGPISVSPTSIPRSDEGLQFHPGVEYSVEYAETQQAPSPYPQHNDFRPDRIPWASHPRRMSSSTQNGSSSIPWDTSRSESNVQTVPPSFQRRSTANTLPHVSENVPPRDIISPDPVRSELDSDGANDSTTTVQPKESASVEVTEIIVQDSRKYWRYVVPILTLCLIAILIAFIVLYLHAKERNTGVLDLIVTSVVSQASATPPAIDSAIAAATIVWGSYFTSPSSSQGPPETKLVYTTSDGAICIKIMTDGSWLSNVQCITSLFPKNHTPLAILDWLGGPSIYFINKANQLYGIDNIPSNNTWKLSSIVSEKVQVHSQSQLAAVTWLNGTSSWLYYQDTDSQLREYGIDDYRDTTWRDGATGPLGRAIDGSGIGAARYLVNGSEVLEVFIQTDNDAIHGRVYMDSVWDADFYSVDGTTTQLSSDAALTATSVPQSTGNDDVFLAWVSSTGFLNVQSRATVNVTQYNAFSAPKQLVEGDGGEQPGLAATGEAGGAVKVDFMNGAKILELQGSEAASENWTTVDITSL